MKFPLLFLCLLSVLIASLGANPQVRPAITPGKAELAKHPLVLDAPIGPQAPQLDLVKLRAEADELAALSQSLPADIDQVRQGKLPKDVPEKLKRIEKLSKRLRGELTR